VYYNDAMNQHKCKMDLLNYTSGNKHNPTVATTGDIVYLNGTFNCFMHDDDISILVEPVTCSASSSAEDEQQHMQTVQVKPYRMSEMSIAFVMPNLMTTTTGSNSNDQQSTINCKVSIHSRKCKTCTQTIFMPFSKQ